MSYDSSIKGDPGCTPTKKDVLVHYLIDELGLLPDSMNHFRVVDQDFLAYSDLDLLAVGTDGSLNYAGDEVSCIQVHIPAAFLMERRVAICHLCCALARHLGWRAYDEQAEQYLDLGN